MPTQIPSTGLPTLARSRIGRVETRCGESSGSALDVADARDHRERRFEHSGRVGTDLGLRPRTPERRDDRPQVAGAVIGEHHPDHADIDLSPRAI